MATAETFYIIIERFSLKFRHLFHILIHTENNDIMSGIKIIISDVSSALLAQKEVDNKTFESE